MRSARPWVAYEQAHEVPASGACAPMIATRPRILQVISHLDLGGAEMVALSLAENLTNQFDLRLFAVRAAKDGPFAQQMADRLATLGIPYDHGTSVKLTRGGLLLAGYRLARRIVRDRPAVVHLHTEWPEATWAMAATLSPAVRRVPVLRTVHNSLLWPAWRPVGTWVERRLGTRAVIAVSNDAAAGLASLRIGASLPPLPDHQLRVVSNGVAVPPARQDAGLPAGRPPRVLFAGRLELQKGADRLPAIWRMLAAAVPGATLTIIGDGTLRPMLTDFSDQTPGVTLEPATYGLSRLLHGFDLLLMPSRFEGLPLLAVEALMARLPVIAFDVAGLRSAFSLDYPLLAPADDVVAFGQRACDVATGVLTLDMAAVSAVTCQRFGLTRMAENYADAYCHLAAGGALNPSPA